MLYRGYAEWDTGGSMDFKRKGFWTQFRVVFLKETKQYGKRKQW